MPHVTHDVVEILVATDINTRCAALSIHERDRPMAGRDHRSYKPTVSRNDSSSYERPVTGLVQQPRHAKDDCKFRGLFDGNVEANLKLDAENIRRECPNSGLSSGSFADVVWSTNGYTFKPDFFFFGCRYKYRFE
jgi:hypothetical protein